MIKTRVSIPKRGPITAVARSAKDLTWRLKSDHTVLLRAGLVHPFVACLLHLLELARRKGRRRRGLTLGDGLVSLSFGELRVGEIRGLVYLAGGRRFCFA